MSANTSVRIEHRLHKFFLCTIVDIRDILSHVRLILLITPKTNPNISRVSVQRLLGPSRELVVLCLEDLERGMWLGC